MIDSEEPDMVDYDLSYWNRDERFYVYLGLRYPATQGACYGDNCPGVRMAKSARFEFGEGKRVAKQPYATEMVRYDF